MQPIVLTYPARIDNVREIIFAVSENEIGMRHCVVAVDLPRPCRQRDARGPLDRLNGPFRSGEADKTRVEEIQPATQHNGRITRGIGGHEDELDAIRNFGGQYFERGAQVRHVHRTLIGAVRVTEEQKRDVTVGALPEIECRTGSIGEDESRLRQRRRDQAAPVVLPYSAEPALPKRKSGEERRAAVSFEAPYCTTTTVPTMPSVSCRPQM